MVAATLKRAGTGRAAHAASKAGQQTRVAPATYGPSQTRPDPTRLYDFKLTAVRGGATDVALSNVENVTWDDPDSIMTGSVTLRDPAYGLGPQITVDEGDQIRCEVDEGGGFHELWTMRVSAPSVDVQPGERTFQLANDLNLLSISNDDFYFQAGKGTAHPNGWSFDEVIREVCAAYRVKVGSPMPVGQYLRKKSWTQRNISPLQVIETAISLERLHTGRRFVLSWRAGALWITPLRRQPKLLDLGPSLIDAILNSHLPAGATTNGLAEGYFASAVTMTSLKAAPKGKDKQGLPTQSLAKMKVSVSSPASVKRFGYVHRIVWSSDAKTYPDLNEEALQYLAAVAKPLKTVTLTHPGIPSIQRGDAIKLGLGDAALQNQVVYVTEVSVTLSPTEYTMVLTAEFDDPYLDNVAQRIQNRVSDTQQGAGQILTAKKLYVNRFYLTPSAAATRRPVGPSHGSALPGDYADLSLAAHDPTADAQVVIGP